MTVAELVHELERMNPNHEVLFSPVDDDAMLHTNAIGEIFGPDPDDAEDTTVFIFGKEEV